MSFARLHGRNFAKYEQATNSVHLAAVNVNPNTICKLYCVLGLSPQGTLPYFDVAPQMAPDIMHDLLEDVFVCVIRHVIKELVSDKILGKSDLERVVHSPRMATMTRKTDQPG